MCQKRVEFEAMSVSFTVNSPAVIEDESRIISSYLSHGTNVKKEGDGKVTVLPYSKEYVFITQKRVPRVGVMLVGIGGNNGTSFTGMIFANKNKIKWDTKRGIETANYKGSLTQATAIRLGKSDTGEDIFIPFKDILPMVEAADLFVTGWDINNMNLGDAMKRAQVFDVTLQEKLYPYMKNIVPLPSLYVPDFVASDQAERANNVIKSETRQGALEQIQKDIQKFKTDNKLDQVVVLWTANTERFSVETPGIHDTAEHILEAIKRNEAEISPSTVFATACILENIPFINGSPQNTLVPGVVDLALKKGVFISGNDFKTGQTKLKSVLTDFLVSSGIKPRSIVSYNHLGNNDGRNLANPRCFQSKEISKKGVVDDIFLANPVLYPRRKRSSSAHAGSSGSHSSGGSSSSALNVDTTSYVAIDDEWEIEHPDHCIVIKYVPYVQDSKRAMDEYSSEICMGGINTIAIHNVCEDSLLAIGVMLDLVILTELLTRITIGERSNPSVPLKDDLANVKFLPFHPLLGSILGFLLKAPQFPEQIPVVNSLFKQRCCLENLFRICRGIAPRTYVSVNKMFNAVKEASKEKK